MRFPAPLLSLLTVGVLSTAAAQPPAAVAPSADAAELARQGRELRESGKYDEAIKCFDNAIRSDPSFDRAYAERARCLYKQGRLEKAIADMNVAIRLYRGEPRYYSLRGSIFLDCSDTQSALHDFETAIATNPGYTDGYYERAGIWENRGWWPNAVKDYTSAIELVVSKRGSPCTYVSLAMMYRKRADARMKTDERDFALVDYTEALRLDPKCAHAFGGRGDYWLVIGKYEQAAKDYTEAIRICPTEPLYSRRSTAYRLQSKVDLAIDDANRAIGISPTTDAYLTRAFSRIAKCDFNLAIDDLDRILKIDPKDLDARFLRASIRYRQGQWAKARAEIDEILAHDPKETYSLLLQVALYASCPDPSYRNGKAALKIAGLLCESTEKSRANSLSALAAAYAELGQFEEAVKWQRKAMESPGCAAAEWAKEALKLYEGRKPVRWLWANEQLMK